MPEGGTLGGGMLGRLATLEHILVLVNQVQARKIHDLDQAQSLIRAIETESQPVGREL